MKFQIGFNLFDDENDHKEFYDFIGAKLSNHEEDDYYEIELESFEELQELMKTINLKYKGNTFSYSAMMSFINPPCIYLDDKN